MTLSNYDNCECGETTMYDINIQLNKILLANMCNKITGYNIYCEKCIKIYQGEQQLLKVKDLYDSKCYLQLKLFLGFNKHPSLFSCISKRSHTQNMKDLFKDEALVKRFGNDAKGVKPYRAFAIKYGDLFKWIDCHISNEYRIQDILREFNVDKRTYFKYYGKEYSVVLLICLIVWDMVYLRIGQENIKYINEDDIMKYVDTIME